MATHSLDALVLDSIYYGAVILSIIANLITPFVSAFLTRRLSARRSGLREKQIKRRDQVITLQANVHRRTSAKLDAIFKLLLALVFLLMSIFVFQLYIARMVSTQRNRNSSLYSFRAFVWDGRRQVGIGRYVTCNHSGSARAGRRALSCATRVCLARRDERIRGWMGSPSIRGQLQKCPNRGSRSTGSDKVIK
jgi:hypothetical protein